MKFEKFSIKGCCGRTSTIFKLNGTISEQMLDFFKNAGYNESPVMTKSGILYVDNSDSIITGSFGSNSLQIKCKKDDCQSIMNKIESLFNQL